MKHGFSNLIQYGFGCYVILSTVRKDSKERKSSCYADLGNAIYIINKANIKIIVIQT